VLDGHGWREAKHRVAALYDAVAPTYGRVGPPMFSVVGRRLVELAVLRAGDRVLDVVPLSAHCAG
jgi:hypothetical protein